MLLYFTISFLFSAAVFAELCFGLSGFLVPLTATAGFYFTVTHRWDRAVIPFAVACTVLDLSYGRQIPFDILVVPPVLLVGTYWRNRGNTKSLVAQTIPGCLIGLMAFMMSSLYSACYGMNTGRGLDFLPVRYALQGFAFGGCAMPLMVVILDGAMGAFGFRKFTALNNFRDRERADD